MPVKNKAIYLSVPEIFPFIFPGYRKLNSYEIMFSSVPVVYYPGNREDISYLKSVFADRFDSYLIMLPNRHPHADLELPEREDVLRFISEVRKIRFTKEVLGKIRALSDSDFIYFLKMSCVLKRWYKEVLLSEEKTYQLFEALTDSRKKFLELYFSLLQKCSSSEIFASVLTFFSRLQMYEEQKESLSLYYRGVIKKAIGMIPNIRKSFLSVLDVPNSIPMSSKLLHFYLSIRG